MKTDLQTKPTKVSVPAFIEGVTDPTRRADAKALVKLMKNVTGEKPIMWGPAIVGFGIHPYTYANGRGGVMPLAAFSPRKAASVLYLGAGFPEHASLVAKLGKHSMGKGCLYIKKLTDVDQKVLEELTIKAVAARRAKQ